MFRPRSPVILPGAPLRLPLDDAVVCFFVHPQTRLWRPHALGGCQTLFPANAPLQAGARAGAVAYYLAFTGLFYGSMYSPDIVNFSQLDRLAPPLSHYALRGVGLLEGTSSAVYFHNLYVVAGMLAAPVAALAARRVYRNLPLA